MGLISFKYNQDEVGEPVGKKNSEKTWDYYVDN